MTKPRSKDISLAQATEILETAFLPLRCGVSENGFGSGLSAAVYADPAVEPVLRMFDMRLPIACYADDLRVFIENARSRVRAKGNVLALWTFSIPQAKKPPA